MFKLIQSFTVGAGIALVLLIGVAASPTDSAVRGFLRGLVDSTASPPPLCQATNATFTTSAATTANAGTLNASIFSNANAMILTGVFSTLLPASAVRTTNTFTNGIGGSLVIIVDALGKIVSVTVSP